MLTIGNLEERCESFRRLLGDDLFTSLTDSFAPESAKSLPEHKLAVAKAHPFAVAWHQLQEDVEKSIKKKSFVLSNESVFLLDFRANLEAISDDPLFDTVLAKLRPRDQYHSTVFEVFMCSGYRHQGAKVEIVAEAPAEGIDALIS